MLNTPVAFIIFNRPDLTKIVFEAIRQVQPKKLLVVADGARKDRPGEAEKCAAARAIIEQVDWDCDVLKNYSDVNLGCGVRVSTGINWIFENVNEAIILEDDCLPQSTFFQFCSQLLEKYKDDERIMMICGTNMLEEWKSNIQSYHSSYYGGIWGWATWKRAWQHYDYHIKLWEYPEVRNRIRDLLCDDEQFEQRAHLFSKTFKGEIDTWDYQWSFTRLLQSGLSIVPSVNLVSNIGFREDATHTANPVDGVSNLPLRTLNFPLKEPYALIVDREYDKKFYLKVGVHRKKGKKYLLYSYIRRIKNKISWL